MDMSTHQSRTFVVVGTCALSALLTTYAGCSSSSDTPPAPIDAARDVQYITPFDANTPVACDPHKPFGPPVLVAGVSPVNLGGVSLSPDELTIYLANQTSGPYRIYAATRAKVTDDFGALAPVIPVNSQTTTYDDYDPSITGDNKTLYFSSSRGVAGSSGGPDLFAAAHDPSTGAFQTPVVLPPAVNSNTEERVPTLSHDQRTLYFGSNRDAGTYHVYQSAVSGGTYDPAIVVPLGDTTGDGSPVVTSDELTLFFNSSRTGSQNSDIWVASRPAKPGVFGAPTNQGDVTAVNSASNDYPAWLSVDGCRLYLTSDRPVGDSGAATPSIYLATRPE